MSPTPPPPPGSGSFPPTPQTPPPAGANYPGRGFQGFDRGDRVVYQYDGTPPGQVPRAPLGRRGAAWLVDTAVTAALPVGALLLVRIGPRRVTTCDLDEDGNLAVLGRDVASTTLCEVPTDAALAGAGLLALLGIAVWIVMSVVEGRSGQSLGKRLVGLRTIGLDSSVPIGAARNLGRNLVRGLLFIALFVPYVVDHLWPLWDRQGQTLHDKVADAVVTTVGS